jgi:uncharacterized membrane protein YdjX (TVP38/TMEM64 family)
MRERSASSNNDIDLSIEKESARPAEGIDSERPPEPGFQDRRRGFLVGAFYLGLVGIPLLLVFGVIGVRRAAKMFVDALPREATVRNAVGFSIINGAIIVTALPLWTVASMYVGFVFGFWYGLGINFLTVNAACMVSFFIGRYVAADTIRGWLLNRRETALITQMIEQNEWKFLLLIRFFPLGFLFKNYCPSTIRVSPLKFCLSVVIGDGLLTTWWTFVGATTKDVASLHEADNGTAFLSGLFNILRANRAQVLLAGSAVTAAISLTVLGSCHWKKAKRESETPPDFCSVASGSSPGSSA